VDLIVADLGNTRLKWGRVESSGLIAESIALPHEDRAAWEKAIARWNLEPGRSHWAISSVNPPIAAQLGELLTRHGFTSLRWFRSAADVPVRHVLDRPETTGADRAFAVAAATRLSVNGSPGLVVSCGTAITVERILTGGVWSGGAIAPGLALSARGLHLQTAQLPHVVFSEAPSAWGTATEPAIAAGVFWGAVGTIRELIHRQSAGLGAKPWVVWTGGDAQMLAPWVSGARARIEPDLVLKGLAFVLTSTDS
jgi:type III pantothenate kinase